MGMGRVPRPGHPLWLASGLRWLPLRTREAVGTAAAAADARMNRLCGGAVAVSLHSGR